MFENPPAINLFGYFLLLIYTGSQQLLEKAVKKCLIGLLRTISLLSTGQGVSITTTDARFVSYSSPGLLEKYSSLDY
jgi:hypothetical protein